MRCLLVVLAIFCIVKLCQFVADTINVPPPQPMILPVQHTSRYDDAMLAKSKTGMSNAEYACFAAVRKIMFMKDIQFTDDDVETYIDFCNRFTDEGFQ